MTDDVHVEEAYGFLTELSEPVHEAGLRDRSLQAGRDEVVINKTWRILIPADAGAIVTTAVDDFRDFLQVSMGEELGLEAYDPATGPENDARAIVIKCAGAEDPFDRQSFAVRSASDWMAVESAGDAGVMYGLFHLEELLAEKRAPFLPPMRVERRPIFATRILRAFHAPYYDNELDGDTTYYSDAYLARLAHQGYNGIWLHQRLRDLVPMELFGAPSDGADHRLEKLKDLIERASRYGIGVYFYLNEPRALSADDPFYGEHPGAKGHVCDRNVMEGEGAYAALCTSDAAVRKSLVEGPAALFHAAPGLAGVIVITMSEHVTHCWSHLSKVRGDVPACARCADRDPAQVVAEVVNLIAEGVHSVAEEAQVIAWTWSWDGAEEVPHAKIMRALRDDVVVMGDFERGQWIKQRKRRWFADEYMLSVPGPTEDFRRKRRLARELGRPIYAKVQIANTHELVTTPYTPVPFKLVEKFTNMKASGVTGYMGCWIFGNYPSIMTEIAGRYSWEPLPERPERFLTALAAKTYGVQGASDAVAAWKRMSRAFSNYPFSQHLVYFGPMNYTCVYPFKFTSEGIGSPISCYKPTSIGDTLDWAKLGLDAPDEADFIREQFEILVSGWREGLSYLERALAQAPDALKQRAARDYGVAEATMLHLDSTTHIIRFLRARDRLATGADRQAAVADMKAAMEKELANRGRLLELVRRDSRIGFHSEGGYFYRPETIEAAIAALEKQLAEDIPGL